ncbi:MAG: rhodanese-like domain-containing protein [Cyanobacteria bacterium J06638_28]
MLNGDHQKWVAEGRPIASEFASFPVTQYAAKAPDASLRVLQSEVALALERSDCLLLDVRTIQEYCGAIFMMKPPEETERSGHIPGAIHLEHTLTLNEDGTFKTAEQLNLIQVQN